MSRVIGDHSHGQPAQSCNAALVKAPSYDPQGKLPPYQLHCLQATDVCYGAHACHVLLLSNVAPCALPLCACWLVPGYLSCSACLLLSTGTKHRDSNKVVVAQTTVSMKQVVGGMVREARENGHSVMKYQVVYGSTGKPCLAGTESHCSADPTLCPAQMASRQSWQWTAEVALLRLLT